VAAAGQGARLTLLARDSGRLATAAASIKAAGHPEPATISADLTVPDQVAAGIDALPSQERSFTHVVCANGSFDLAPFISTSPARLESLFSENVTAVFNLVRILLPGMIERGGGHVLAVGSVAARLALPGNTAYSTAKHGLRGLLQVMAVEHADEGIVVTLVHPPAVDTPLWDRLPAAVQERFDRTSFLRPAEIGEQIVPHLFEPPGSFTEVDLF